ncbi:MAG: hypothetical protein H7338_09260 [Candidatus Sericytochromatia bacterium]|nr:hypothetical protein [Candidatus Sericytochromatia bacterium]
MSRAVTKVVDALSQRKIQAALDSLDAICGDCPDPICTHDPRACPINDSRRALTLVFLADWVEDDVPPAEASGGGCSTGGGCSSGGCGTKF